MAERVGLKTRGVGAAVTGAGAAVVATAAGACCLPIVAPLIVAVLGVSGAAWAAGLKPYSVYFLIGSLGALLYGFWAVYKPREAAPGVVCATSGSRSARLARGILWCAAALWMAAVALNALPYLLLWVG